MSGFAKGGVLIPSGSNLAIAGQKPSGVAAQGQVIWTGSQWQFLFVSTASAGFSVTTPAVDTTDVDLLVFYSTQYTAASYMISDSANNIWTQGVSESYGAYTSNVFYCFHPQTSQQHVFQASSSNYTTVLVAAFNAPSSIISDQQSAIGGIPASVQLPAITPVPNSLVVSSLAAGWNYILSINSIDSSFLIVGQVPQTGQSSLQALAYAVVADALPLAPTWTISTADRSIATMLSFIPSPWQLLASTFISMPTVQIVMDTTGADLLVALAMTWQGALSLSDNLGNSWTAGVDAYSGGPRSQIAYCIAPSAGVNHVFTFSPVNYSSFAILAFKSSSPISVGQTSTVIGSNQITVQQSPMNLPVGALVVGAMTGNQMGGSLVSLDNNFSVIYSIPQGSLEMAAVSYLINGTSNTIAPTWTMNIAVSQSAGAMLSFIPALPWQLLASTASIAPANTTPAIDTTGANLLIVVDICWAYGLAISDSKSNTWTLGPSIGVGSGPVSQIFYCINPTVGTGHTFSFSGSGQSPSIVAAAIKSQTPNILVDQSNTVAMSTPATTVNIPITPTAPTSLIISSVTANTSIISVDQNFSIIENITSGLNGMVANLQQTTPATVAPTFTLASAQQAAAAIMNFILSPWQLLASTSVVFPNTTSSAIDTTGAKLLVITIAGGNPVGLSDNQGNIFTQAASSQMNSANNIAGIYYCINPKTSSSHTITNSTQYGTAILQAFAGPSSIVLDQTNAAFSNANAYSATSPSITPSAVGSLVIASVGANATLTNVTQGLTITNSTAYVSGVSYGAAASYLILGQPQSLAPVWSFGQLSVSAFAIVSFLGA